MTSSRPQRTLRRARPRACSLTWPPATRACRSFAASRSLFAAAEVPPQSRFPEAAAATKPSVPPSSVRGTKSTIRGAYVLNFHQPLKRSSAVSVSTAASVKESNNADEEWIEARVCGDEPGKAARNCEQGRQGQPRRRPQEQLEPLSNPKEQRNSAGSGNGPGVCVANRAATRASEPR